MEKKVFLADNILRITPSVKRELEKFNCIIVNDPVDADVVLINLWKTYKEYTQKGYKVLDYDTFIHDLRNPKAKLMTFEKLYDKIKD